MGSQRGFKVIGYGLMFLMALGIVTLGCIILYVTFKQWRIDQKAQRLNGKSKP